MGKIEKRFINRHRLQKKDPSAAIELPSVQQSLTVSQSQLKDLELRGSQVVAKRDAMANEVGNKLILKSFINCK